MYRSTDINNFRSPSVVERELISELTAAEFPGRAEVIKQLQQCVVRVIDEEGSLEVGIPPHAIAAPVLHRVPTELYGPDVDGVQISVLLHVVDGVCREIEIYKVDGTDIQRMPAIWQRFVPGPDDADSS
ncbi:DUF6984 family protein [Burkholderia sp. Bp9031]|uniref:DUF6984 family protein n=1 Tax=Burkholderia sp. Bp9031 TaxID=2184566 RepID=UPI000F5FC13A|nr:hypothetical protein [Burkholderia sp. Bp9031]